MTGLSRRRCAGSSPVAPVSLFALQIKMVCCLNWHAYSEYGQQTGSRTRCSLPGVSGKTAPQKGIRVGALDNVVKLWLRGALECGFRNLSGGPRFGPASNADAYPRLTSGGGSAMRCAGPSKPQPLHRAICERFRRPPKPSQVHTGAGIWTYFPDRLAYRFVEIRSLEWCRRAGPKTSPPAFLFSGYAPQVVLPIVTVGKH